MSGLASRIVNHLFATARNRDGQAPGLEQISALAGLIPIGSGGHEVDASLPVAATRLPRLRTLRSDALQDALAQKVLHGWVQNRNQTLHPLTLNFAVLNLAQAELLLEMAALALAAGGDVGEPQLRRAATALEAAGGEAFAARLPALLDSPRPLHVVFNALREADLTGSAYAVTVAAVDQRDLTNRAFAAYVASRLAIPETVSRSIGRRYRR